MKKKGFTLVELLGVVIIIGLLLLIGIPAINKYINKGKNVYYTSLEKEIKTSGADYLNSYRTLLPRAIKNNTVISLKELEENEYMDKVVDEDGEKCIGQVVAQKVKTDSYKYYTCLKCGSKYQTKTSEICIPDNDSETGFRNIEIDNVYADSGDYKIEIEDKVLTEEEINKGYEVRINSEPKEYIVPQGEPFIFPEAKILHKENGEWKEVDGQVQTSPKEVDTNILGTKKVIYYYHGAKTEIKVIVVDKTQPSKPEIVLKYENANGSDYRGNWYSGAIYASYKSTDYTKERVMGSGIKNYLYSIDGTNWIEVRKNNDSNLEYVDWTIIDVNAINNKVVAEDGEYTIKVKAEDNNGNIGPVNEYTIKIDTNAPECELQVISGDIGNENWYKTGIKVGYKIREGTGTNVLTDPIQYVDKNGQRHIERGTIEINTDEKDLLVYGTVTDEAGNTNICKLKGIDGREVINIDPKIPTTPTMTATDGKTQDKWHWQSATINITGTNNLSGNIYYYKANSQPLVSNGRTNGTQGSTLTHTGATSGTIYYGMICSVAGNCGNPNTYTVKVDNTAPTTNFYKVNNDTAYLDCSDPESGVVTGRVQVAINAQVISGTCTNGAGGTITPTHTCTLNPCKTTKNTCSYGCDSCYNECQTGSPCGKTTQGACNSWGSSSGTQGVGQGSSGDGFCDLTCRNKSECNCSCNGNDALAVDCTATWCTGHATVCVSTCQGGYEDCNCNDCHSGSPNECVAGWVW